MRVVFGLVDLLEPTNAKGESISFESTPFIWEIDNRDAFKTLGLPFTKLAQLKRLPIQHTIDLATEERKLPNGNVFYLPTSTLDIANKVDLSEADQATFGDFMSWIQNYNQYIVKEWDANMGGNASADMKDIVNDFIEVDAS